MRVFELWVEARVPRGNLCRQKETVQTHTKRPQMAFGLNPGPFCCYLLFQST